MRYHVRTEQVGLGKQLYWIEHADSGLQVAGTRTRNKRKAERFCDRLNGTGSSSRSAAFGRRAERRTKRRKRKAFGKYPMAGFQEKRKQLNFLEKTCEGCGITGADHLKKFGVDLALDHILPARWLALLNLDPHKDWNLEWLCSGAPQNCHGRGKREAEAQLMGKGGLFGFITVLRTANWPAMASVRRALDGYGFRTEGLPW